MTAEVLSIWGRLIHKANEDAKKSPCARVNERTAREYLVSMSTIELNVHISDLDVELRAKRAGIQATQEALARALSEKVRRRG